MLITLINNSICVRLEPLHHLIVTAVIVIILLLNIVTGLYKTGNSSGRTVVAVLYQGIVFVVALSKSGLWLLCLKVAGWCHIP